MDIHPPILRAILLLAAAIATGGVVNFLLSNRVLRLAERLTIPLHRESLLGMRGPVIWCVTSGILYWGIPNLLFPPVTTQVMLKVVQLAVYAGVVVLAFRVVTVLQRVFSRYASRTQGKLDDQLVPLLCRIGKGAVILVGILFVLQNQGDRIDF